ncbi:MAG: GntR family transcriptional regulator [bacterium]
MSAQLDFSGRTQLYFQLYDILYKNIIDGVYKPGELLPTENELIDQYHISRVTVRKAMDLLMNDGLIAKRRGYGTFVQKHKVEQTLNKVLHFSNEMEKRGYRSSTSVLANEVVCASKTIADELHVSEGDQLIRVIRLRFADGVPMCMESAYLIHDKCPKVLEQDFAKNSLREFLASQYGIVWIRAHQKIFSINANAKLAGNLDILNGDPLIYIERVSYDQNDEPGEYLQAYYRGDTYYLTAELNAQSIANEP